MSKKDTDDQTQKFGPYLYAYMYRKSLKQHYLNDIVPIMESAINDGLTRKPKCPNLKDAIGKYLFSFVSSGRAERLTDDSGVSYWMVTNKQRSRKNAKKEAIGDNPTESELTKFDNYVLEVFRSASSQIMSVEVICGRLKFSSDYLEISKEISGSINKCVETSLGKLVKAGLIDEDLGNYCLAK